MVFKIAALIAPLIIRILAGLCRCKVEDEHYYREAVEQGKGLILTIWHGRMLLLIDYHKHSGVTSLVSRSFDGELIARVVNRLGYSTHRGSPRDGGGDGFKLMLRDLRKNKKVCMFPDGPTGPRHTVRDGTLLLARLSGAPIIPATFSAIPSWRAKSWDKFMIMRPFSKGIIKYGEPIYVPRKFSIDQDMEYYRKMVQFRMIELESKLDQQLGIID